MPAALLGQPKPPVPQSKEPEPEKLDYAAAFLILIGKDGAYEFEPDINRPITVDRPPTSSEVKGSLAAVLSDIQVQETAILAANTTVGAQMQMAMQMRDAQINQGILQGMNK